MEGVLSAAGQLPHLQHLHITLPESYAECEQHPLSWSAAGAVAKLDHLQTLRCEAAQEHFTKNLENGGLFDQLAACIQAKLPCQLAS
eukprot:1159968-Pelagomonas_calceolata.AAC.14